MPASIKQSTPRTHTRTVRSKLTQAGVKLVPTRSNFILAGIKLVPFIQSKVGVTTNVEPARVKLTLSRSKLVAVTTKPMRGRTKLVLRPAGRAIELQV